MPATSSIWWIAWSRRRSYSSSRAFRAAFWASSSRFLRSASEVFWFRVFSFCLTRFSASRILELASLTIFSCSLLRERYFSFAWRMRSFLIFSASISAFSRISSFFPLRMERLTIMYAAKAIAAPATNPITKDMMSIYIVCYVQKKPPYPVRKSYLSKIWGPADSGIPLTGRARHPRPEYTRFIRTC